MPLYDHELTLLQETVYEDELGNQRTDETEKNILCSLKSVGGAEFYNASMNGMKPEIIFVVHRYEYEGEIKVIFDNTRYRVIRTYATGFEELELTCEKVTGND